MEDKGFTITDKRIFSQTSDKPATEPPEPETIKQANPEKPSAPKEQTLLPVDFGSFIISLSHAAMIHLGYDSTSGNEGSSVNISLARHAIDTIAMLKEKTLGNLTNEEASLVENILTELRMLYVQVRKNQ